MTHHIRICPNECTSPLKMKAIDDTARTQVSEYCICAVNYNSKPEMGKKGRIKTQYFEPYSNEAGEKDVEKKH